MKLAKSDTDFFYQLWFPLLDYVNRKYQIHPEITSINREEGINIRDAKDVSDYCWSHEEIIEQYLAEANLPEEHARIIAEWKGRKRCQYILERHLKKGSVFISLEDETVYMVKGLYLTWEETVGQAPAMLETVLLPFRGNIISDGLIGGYNVIIGPHWRAECRDIYMEAKRNNAIRFTL